MIDVDNPGKRKRSIVPQSPITVSAMKALRDLNAVHASPRVKIKKKKAVAEDKVRGVLCSGANATR